MPRGIPASGKRNYQQGHPGRAGQPDHPRHGRKRRTLWLTDEEFEAAQAAYGPLRAAKEQQAQRSHEPVRPVMTDQQCREIAGLYGSGVASAQIAQQYGITRQSVTRIVRRLNES